MHSELRRLVRSIETGIIREPDQVRRILADARAAEERDKERASNSTVLIYRAEQAFLKGWPKLVDCD